MSAAVLSIDASTDSCSVALRKNGVTWHRQSAEPRAHAQRLLPMVDEVLLESETQLNQLDYLALVSGPGSFTGIRIAFSVVQGLAYGASLPIVCMPSLETLAQQALSQHDLSEQLIVSALDARMDEIYWAAYRANVQGKGKCSAEVLVEIQPPTVSSKQDFLSATAALKTSQSMSLRGFGSGFGIEGLCLDEFAVFDANVSPNAQALLTLLEHKSDISFHQASEIEPLYLRNEVTWKKRERIRQVNTR